jgi:hypothetical protein
MNPDIRVYESDKSWIDRGGQLGCNFDALELSDRARKIVDDPHARGGLIQPEQRLWAAVIRQAINEAMDGRITGVPKRPSELSCTDCHVGASCSCPSFSFQKKDARKVQWGTNHYLVIRHPNPRQFPGQYDKNWLKMCPKYVWERPDGKTCLYRILNPRCPSAHTFQECALKWIASKDFEDACDLCGMEAATVRKHIKEEMSVKSRQETSSDTRLSGEAGSAA